MKHVLNVVNVYLFSSFVQSFSKRRAS